MSDPQSCRVLQWIYLLCLLFLNRISARDTIIDLGYAKHTRTFVNVTESGRRIEVFKNIRYAKPPVKKLRFRRPDVNIKPVHDLSNGQAPWLSTSCISTAPAEVPYAGLNGTTWGTEDCLYLDVYAPEHPPNRRGPLPVIHWIPGSGYSFGSKELSFNPMGLFDAVWPDQDFILVTNNFRLGAVGWTSMPEEGLHANLGLHDCIAALNWTKKHIGLFGGNPELITAMGQGSGATMIQLMTVTNTADELPFQQAIVASPAIPPRKKTAERRKMLFKALLDAASCKDLACLRGIPEARLKQANSVLMNTPTNGEGGVLGPSLGFGPVVDGRFLSETPQTLYKQGRYHHEIRRLIVGSMANESMGLIDDIDITTKFPMLVRNSPPNASSKTTPSIQSRHRPSIPEHLAWEWISDIPTTCNAYDMAEIYKDRTYRYIMSIPPSVHGQDMSYFFFENRNATPVSVAEIARHFQIVILGFIQGDDVIWPIYGSEHALINVTAVKFDPSNLPADVDRRCQSLNADISDIRNGA